MASSLERLFSSGSGQRRTERDRCVVHCDSRHRNRGRMFHDLCRYARSGIMLMPMKQGEVVEKAGIALISDRSCTYVLSDLTTRRADVYLVCDHRSKDPFSVCTRARFTLYRLIVRRETEKLRLGNVGERTIPDEFSPFGLFSSRLPRVSPPIDVDISHRCPATPAFCLLFRIRENRGGRVHAHDRVT